MNSLLCMVGTFAVPTQCPALAAAAVLCFSGSITITGLLYHWFAPGGHDCSFNITVITLALVLCVAFSMLSLHPAVSSPPARRGGVPLPSPF